MHTPSHTPSWVEDNQAYLVAHFAWLKALLSAQAPAEAVAPRDKVRAAMASPPAIDRLVELFTLSDFERDVLLLCAGVEMDSALAALCGEAQGFPQHTFATFGLAAALLPEPHWSALEPSRPLRCFRLVEVEGGHGLTSAPLRIDERILHYLAGVNRLDGRLQPLLQIGRVPEWIAADHQAVADQAIRVLQRSPHALPVLHLCGDDPQGQEDTACLVAHAYRWQLCTLHAEDLSAVGPDMHQLAALWEREARLLPGALLLHCPAGGWSASVRHLAERLPGPLFVASREPVRLSRAFVRFDVHKPPPPEQKRLWEQVLGPAAGTCNGILDALSEQFRLSARTIFTTAALATVDEDPFKPQALWHACRALARPRLEDLAERIVPCASWDVLILPDAQMQTLRQVADQVRYRLQVYATWGFADKGQRHGEDHGGGGAGRRPGAGCVPH
jgi:hypothetical protein